MHTDLENKVATLLENHAELERLIHSDRFKQFDADSQLALLKLREEAEATVNTLNVQVDALDVKIADMLCVHSTLTFTSMKRQIPAMYRSQSAPACKMK